MASFPKITVRLFTLVRMQFGTRGYLKVLWMFVLIVYFLIIVYYLLLDN